MGSIKIIWSWTDRFGSTYLCEKAEIKYVKSHYELALTGGHVQFILMTGNNDIEPRLSETLYLPKIEDVYSHYRPILWKIG
jgi:hypothetical protein